MQSSPVCGLCVTRVVCTRSRDSRAGLQRPSSPVQAHQQTRLSARDRRAAALHRSEQSRGGRQRASYAHTRAWRERGAAARRESWECGRPASGPASSQGSAQLSQTQSRAVGQGVGADGEGQDTSVRSCQVKPVSQDQSVNISRSGQVSQSVKSLNQLNTVLVIHYSIYLAIL